VFNGLEPGMSVRLVYGDAETPGALLMSGHTLSVQSAAGALTEYCRWNLPVGEIHPGVPYTVTVDGSSVEVAADG